MSDAKLEEHWALAQVPGPDVRKGNPDLVDAWINRHSFFREMLAFRTPAVSWTNKAPTEPGWYWLFTPTGTLNAAEFRRPQRRSALRRLLGADLFGGSVEFYSTCGCLFYPVTPPELPHHG